jgi:hypothetical protein
MVCNPRILDSLRRIQKMKHKDLMHTNNVINKNVTHIHRYHSKDKTSVKGEFGAMRIEP